jgi:hypothetical protein
MSKVMSKKEVKDFCKTLIADGPIPDCEAFDIAEGCLYDEGGLKEGIIAMGIRDPHGWLANQIV